MAIFTKKFVQSVKITTLLNGVLKIESKDFIVRTAISHLLSSIKENQLLVRKVGLKNG